MKGSWNRRQVLGAGLGATAAVAVVNAGFAQGGTPVASPAASPVAGGPWSFTDDRGVTVELEAVPQKLVIDTNVAGGLWDFGVRPVGIFGWLSTVTDGTLPPAAGRVDPNAVENYGLGEGAIDLERLAAAQPDLIVTYTFAPDDPTNLWSVLPDDLERLESIAPIVALSGVTSLPESVARFSAFAESLGYDVNTPEIVGVREGVLAAEERAKVLTSANPGFSASWIAPNTEAFFMANPLRAQGVIYARSLGVKVPTLDVPETDYWQEFSYEQALAFPTDLLYVSVRNGPDVPQQLMEHEIFSQHPAVQAGQVYAWNQDVIVSWQGWMAVMVELLMALETADSSVVEEEWD